MVLKPDAADDGNARVQRRSRDDVIAAALVILDERGLRDLTMRNLAVSLGLQPSALYWHFPNKQTLLAAVADEIVARARPAGSGASWHDLVRAEALALRDALLAFTDAAEVVSSTLALGLGARDAGRRLADAIREGGFDADASDEGAEVLLHFIIGQTSYHQQRLQADSLGVLPEDAGPTVFDADSGRLGVFERGISLLLAGLEAERLASSRSRIR